jgi:hypothetical protein
MKTETAQIKYQDSKFLEYVVDKYNHSHRKSTRSCELSINDNGNHKISIIDEADLIPYGIFDIGIQIGFIDMHNNFRLELKSWAKKYSEIIFDSNIYPKDELYEIELKDGQHHKIPIRNIVGINSSIGNIKPFINKDDFIKIYEKSNFQIIRSSTVMTQKNKRINYYIQDNYLFLFGVDLKYSPNHYQIELESIFEINIPKDDF